jgi:chemotaxis protein CheD
MKAGELMARMGEYVASGSANDVLVSLGLGSCIGLALVDRRAGVSGLAHVVLPEGTPREGEGAGKWANTAVPALLELMEGHGARSGRLDAVLVGGASMFASAARGLEVGQRNEAAIREQLMQRRIPVRAAQTGGNRGRTIRVRVGDGVVTVREAGGSETQLWPATAARRTA